MSGNNSPPPMLGDAPVLALTPVVVVVLVGIFVALWRWRASVLEKRATDNAAFEAALGSDNLEVLGAYLRDQLGALRLDAFADSEKARGRAKKLLGRLREHVNQPAPPSTAGATGQFEVEQAIEPPTTVGVPTVISEARTLLSESQGWSAFALLRRELERALRGRDLLPEKRALPPPSVIAPKNLQTAYGIFLRTANRSIHGEDINSEEEERAMSAATFLFNRLDQIEIRKIDRLSGRISE